MPRTGSRSCRTPGRVQWLAVPNWVSTTRVAGAGVLRDPRLSTYRASGASISRAAARIEKCPWPGVELKLRARYRLGVEPGMPGRDRRVRIPVVDRCRHRD